MTEVLRCISRNCYEILTNSNKFQSHRCLKNKKYRPNWSRCFTQPFYPKSSISSSPQKLSTKAFYTFTLRFGGEMEQELFHCLFLCAFESFYPRHKQYQTNCVKSEVIVNLMFILSADSIHLWALHEIPHCL